MAATYNVQTMSYLCARDNGILTFGNGIPIVSFIENQSGAVYIRIEQLH